MDTIILLLFGTVIAILAIVIVGVCYYYAKLVHKFSKAQKENLYLRFHLQEKSLGKINEARDRALKIVSDASMQAEEILKKTQVIQSDSAESYKKQLEELTNKQKESLTHASEALSSSFNDTIKQLEEDDVNVFRNVSKDLETATLHEVEEFKKQLTAGTVESQKQVDEKVQEAFQHAMEEVTAYKAKRIEVIDEQLFRILSEVTKEIIGKRLTYDDQKDLLRQSLEKVKQEINAVA